MRIFLDSGNVQEVNKWRPVISGITTNPLILEKDGGDIYELAKAIAPDPICIEACGDYVTDADTWTRDIRNAVIKIPLLRPDGSDNINLISALVKRGIVINCTALMSLSQVILAERTGARYVSLFAGRIDDEGGDYYSVIAKAVKYLDDQVVNTELIVGSVRTVGNVLDAIEAGTHIVTIPPAILEKMVKHEYSLKTVRQFEDAYTRISS